MSGSDDVRREDTELVARLRALQGEWRVTDAEFSCMLGASAGDWRAMRERPTPGLGNQTLHRAGGLIEIGERLKIAFAPGIAADWMTIETGRWGAPRAVDVCRDPAGLAVVLAHVRALCEGY